MLEIPEAAVLAMQVRERLAGLEVREVVAGSSPHKFAWFTKDPESYRELLIGKKLRSARGLGGMVELDFGGMKLAFSDGVSLRLYEEGEKLPAKHQLLMTFEDGSSLVASVQMYGGLALFAEGSYDNVYYLNSRLKPSPLTAAFDYEHFLGLFRPSTDSLSLKAFLATEQRVPGLGNGVLQDILYEARLNPKKKVSTLDEGMKRSLFRAIKEVLARMRDEGGRDLETDLYGRHGGYRTRMGRNTAGTACEGCRTGTVVKESYLGGSIYYCDKCQKK